MLQYCYAQPLIHINPRVKNKNFCIAYMLGHFFFNFNPDQSVLFIKMNNPETIVFATELVLTDEILFSQLSKISTISLKEIASFFNLPIQAIKIKLDGISNNRIIFSCI
nr:hypothetical protein [Virgibacillus sp. Bac332]